MNAPSRRLARLARITLGTLAVAVLFTAIGWNAWSSAAREAARQRGLRQAAEARWGKTTWDGVENAQYAEIWRLTPTAPPADWQEREPPTEPYRRGQSVLPRQIWTIRLRNALEKWASESPASGPASAEPLSTPPELRGASHTPTPPQHPIPNTEHPTCVPRPDAVVHFIGAQPPVDLIIAFDCQLISLAPVDQVDWTDAHAMQAELVKLLHENFPDDEPIRKEWEKGRKQPGAG